MGSCDQQACVPPRLWRLAGGGGLGGEGDAGVPGQESCVVAGLGINDQRGEGGELPCDEGVGGVGGGAVGGLVEPGESVADAGVGEPVALRAGEARGEGEFGGGLAGAVAGGDGGELLGTGD